MSYTTRTPILTGISTRPLPGVPVRQGVALESNRRHQLLADCLEVVGRELDSARGPADAAPVRGALDEVVAMVRSEGDLLQDLDYAGFVRRLTSLYASACNHRENAAVAATAEAYAAVIAAIGQSRPRLDLTLALGQLLELMTRLFSAGDIRWKLVHQHLRSVPDSVRAKQTLNHVCAAGVSEWLDAGVQNLFGLRDDLVASIQALSARARRIQAKIRARQRALADARDRLDPSGTGKVILLEGPSREREISALKREKGLVLEEREGRKGTLELIESDIREFENRLRGARRAYYLRPVCARPRTTGT